MSEKKTVRLSLMIGQEMYEQLARLFNDYAGLNPEVTMASVIRNVLRHGIAVEESRGEPGWLSKTE